MRRIEFAGLPGSGKSSIVTEAGRILCAGDSPCFDRARIAAQRRPLPSKALTVLQGMLPQAWQERVARRLFWKLVLPEAQARVSSAFPALFTAIQREAQSGGDPPEFVERFVGYATDVLAWHLIASEWLAAREAFLCDEGFVQRLASLASPGDAKSWLPMIPRVDLLFVVRASRETCMERMQQRARGLPQRFVGRSWAEVDAALARMEGLVLELERALLEAGTPVVRVDTDELDLGAATTLAVESTIAWMRT